jgi:hypothetical protein
MTFRTDVQRGRARDRELLRLARRDAYWAGVDGREAIEGAARAAGMSLEHFLEYGQSKALDERDSYASMGYEVCERYLAGWHEHERWPVVALRWVNNLIAMAVIGWTMFHGPYRLVPVDFPRGQMVPILDLSGSAVIGLMLVFLLRGLWKAAVDPEVRREIERARRRATKPRGSESGQTARGRPL